jgi:hypothetical protein
VTPRRHACGAARGHRGRPVRAFCVIDEGDPIDRADVGGGPGLGAADYLLADGGGGSEQWAL